MPNLTEKIILQAAKRPLLGENQLATIVREVLRSIAGKKTMPNKMGLLKAYHKLLAAGKVKKNAAFEQLLKKRGVRTLSGVSIITVLTEPYPCPGRCVYCPDEKKMPKSYLSDEPAAARALALHFDPYEQVAKRIEALAANGHPTDKIELIVKGGTWNAYPEAYQYWFVLRCFEACNVKIPARGGSAFGGKNKKNRILKVLKIEQGRNEKAGHRIIGLTLETRPDFINVRTIAVMRELGCTRVEMGVQTIDEKILKLIKRGHDANEVKRATALLKNNGFKVDYHLMPQLPDATPEKDLKMMREIFDNPDYRPDMIKIYPCSVIKNSELYRWFKKGKYKPYSDRHLINILKKFKSALPYYVRISRLIRDIPAHHIQAGNKMTNLRQVIQAEMTAEGSKCNCLRCREIGHRKNLQFPNCRQTAGIPNFRLKLFTYKYEASGGTEYFFSYEDPKRECVYAFCRLRVAPRLAFIRELHVYGQSLEIGARNKKTSQHKGLGKQLMAEAEKICRKNKIPTLAVISGVGVRDYYRKLGYRLSGTYMVKKLFCV